MASCCDDTSDTDKFPGEKHPLLSHSTASSYDQELEEVVHSVFVDELQAHGAEVGLRDDTEALGTSGEVAAHSDPDSENNPPEDQDIVEVVQNAFVEELNAFGNDTVAVDLAGSMTLMTSEETEPDPSYLLEMSLTRNLSIPPCDVADAAAADVTLPGIPEQIEEQQPGKSEDATTGIPPMAYLLLALAVVTLSATGPLLIVQEGATPPMKLFWRMLGTSLFLLPFTLRKDFSIQHKKTVWWPQGLTSQDWLIFLLTAACYATSCLGFVLALDYTSVGNATILSNSQAIMLLLGRVVLKGYRTVARLEGTGAVVAFLGAVLCSLDSSNSGGPQGQMTWLGDLLGLLAGIGGTGYLSLAKNMRSKMPLCLFMCLVMFVGCLFVLVFQILILGETVTLCMDEETGIWGFLSMRKDRLPLEIVIVVICNGLGAMGYISAMKHFTPLVVAVASLLEPIGADFIAAALGVGFLPDLKGWLGNGLVAMGTLAVIFPSDRIDKEEVEEEDKSQASTNSSDSTTDEDSWTGEYELKIVCREAYTPCTFWQLDRSSEYWPSHGTRIRGSVVENDDRELVASHAKQPNNTWRKIPQSATSPIEIVNHYSMEAIEEIETAQASSEPTTSPPSAAVTAITNPTTSPPSVDNSTAVVTTIPEEFEVTSSAPGFTAYEPVQPQFASTPLDGPTPKLLRLHEQDQASIQVTMAVSVEAKGGSEIDWISESKEMDAL